MTMAIIYARVSMDRQAEEELPLIGQVEQCRGKAEQLGARMVRTFIDEGISGRVPESDFLGTCMLTATLPKRLRARVA